MFYTECYRLVFFVSCHFSINFLLRFGLPCVETDALFGKLWLEVWLVGLGNPENTGQVVCGSDAWAFIGCLFLCFYFCQVALHSVLLQSVFLFLPQSLSSYCLQLYRPVWQSAYCLQMFLGSFP